MINKLYKVLRHNHVLVACVGISIVLVAWGYGCQVTTRSPFKPDTRVTRDQLNAEIDLYVSRITQAYDDLLTKEQIRQLVFNQGVNYVSGNEFNPLGFISTLAGIVGVGAVIDNRRKDSVIKAKSNALDALTNNKGKVT